MMRLIWRRAATLAIVAIGAVITGTWTAEQLREREATRLDQREVARMIAKMKTVCIGRFLIDMPQGAQVELSNPNIDGFDFSSFKESAEGFQRRIAARESEIKAKPDRLGGNDNLESATEIKTDHGVAGRMFVHNRQVTEGTAANGMELEHYHFQNERIMMFARLPHHPDIESSLILLAGTKPDAKGLLTRNAESNARLSVLERLRVSRLRAVERTISGLHGEEVIERFSEANNVNVFSFWWEGRGTADDVMLPHLSFTMDTGKSDKGPVPSSLSQDAALALWDKVSSSIRFHHTPEALHTQPTSPAGSSN